MKIIFTVKKIPKTSWSSNNPLNLKPKFITLLLLIIGLTLFGIGESLLISTGAGVSPWTVFAQGISNYTNWTIGFSTLIVSLGILVLWVPLSQKPGIGTILNAIIIAAAIEYSLKYMPTPEIYYYQILQVVVGILIVGIGSGIYLIANLGPGPRDGLMTGIQRITDLPIAMVRASIEISAVGIGWMMGGTVGLGTILFAFGIGPAVVFGLTLTVNMTKKN